MPEVWEMQPGESNLWYGRFDIYRLMGSERSVLKAFNAWRARYGKPPAKQGSGIWNKKSVEDKWKNRAEAWDVAERKRMADAREEQVKVLFDNIEQATKAFYSKFAQRLAALDPADLPASILLPQFLSIVNKLEELYGRVPARRLEVTGDGGGPVGMVVDLNYRRQVLELVDRWERDEGLIEVEAVNG